MIINFVFRFLLTINATSLLIIIFLVKQGWDIAYFNEWIAENASNISPLYSYFLYFILPVVSTGLSIYLSRYLGKDFFDKGDVESIEYANNSFLPSYLGYFFVALSINNFETLVFVYFVVFIFTFLSQALYFNPLFLLYRYNFFNIKTRNGASIFLISRKTYKVPSKISISCAHRVNDFTFIEKG